MKNKCGLCFPIIAILLFGCSKVGHNAKLYDDVEGRLNVSFVSEHKLDISTWGTFEPDSFVFVVDSVQKYGTAFNEDYQIDIDYEKQFLILHSFISFHRKDHYINSITVSDGALMIECDYKHGFPGMNFTCSPYQRWCAIVMDIVEYNSIAFIGEGN